MHTTSSTLVLVLAVFGASLVEMVEALTIVVAAGVSRGWRSALEGAASAALVLGVLVVAIGVPLVRYIPLDALRVVVGALLLVLGLSWLRKAILRGSGHKDLHDEDKIYAETVAELEETDAADVAAPAVSALPVHHGRDGVAFAVAFKGVFLEGAEVVLIVISLGAAQHRLGLAAVAAGAAVVIVAGVGLVVSRQLSEVPENTIKTAVGIMLTSFGIFWVGEGAGVQLAGQRPRHPRPGRVLPRDDPRLHRVHEDEVARSRIGAASGGMTALLVRGVKAFGLFWWDFLVGDTPELALATGAIVALAFLISGERVVGVILLPLLAAGFLLASTLRGRRRAPGK